MMRVGVVIWALGFFCAINDASFPIVFALGIIGSVTMGLGYGLERERAAEEG